MSNQVYFLLNGFINEQLLLIAGHGKSQLLKTTTTKNNTGEVLQLGTV